MTSPVQASAPSNIALIKYMGKIEGSGNRPTNASLSYTLEHLRTEIEIESISGDVDLWKPLSSKITNEFPLKLSESGQKKFLQHFQWLKNQWKISGHFELRSGNNFPSDAGLASSASSFAALTQASYQLKRRTEPDFFLSSEELSKFSRQGSGSSCRSLFSPWALWKEEGAEAIEIHQRDLIHGVLILEEGKKAVSSSEAHKRVISSPLFAKDHTGMSRPERAEMRLQSLLQAFKENRWDIAFKVCWQEFWDMHELFHTSQPGFTYLTPLCREILQEEKRKWNRWGRGPLITLDAGPNIHWLFRKEDQDLLPQWFEDILKLNKKLLTSHTEKSWRIER